MRIESSDPVRHDGDATDTGVSEQRRDEHPAVGGHHDASIDDSLRLYAQNSVPQQTRVDAQGGPAFNDKVMYVGMNTVEHQCDKEARSLGTGAVVIGHSERDAALGADKVRVGTRVVDLATDGGVNEFVASLGLPNAQAGAIVGVLRHAHAGSRDELAGIATAWARGEKGGAVPSRIVLSGHCFGDGIWDGGTEGLGNIAFSSIHELATAMPKASAQIEDVMISACSSGFDGASAMGTKLPLSDWKKTFPNLKTAWGYGSPTDYHSPTGQQAVMHVGAWEHATRGRAQNVDGKSAVDSYFKSVEDAAKKVKPDFKLDKPQLDGNVSVWTASRGYVQGRG